MSNYTFLSAWLQLPELRTRPSCPLRGAAPSPFRASASLNAFLNFSGLCATAALVYEHQGRLIDPTAKPDRSTRERVTARLSMG
jgi:hypothetical protein